MQAMRSTWRALAALLLAFPLMSAHAVDGDELTRDLLRIHNAPNGHEFVYWLPAGAVTALVPGTDPAATRAITAAFAGYELFLVEHMAGSAAHGPDDAPAVLAPVRLKLASGQVLDALREADMPPRLIQIANIFKAMMNKDPTANKNTRVVMFKLPSPADEPRIDTAQRSILTLLVGDVPLVWHLPLAGAGPSSIDPDSGEKFPGGFAFNPYTGAPLKHE